MTSWQSALERVVAATGHERFRALCSDAHPDRETWRRKVIERAGGLPADYPPAATQAASLLAAAGRFVASGFATVDRDEFDRRRSTCRSCPELDAEADRCRKCGCHLGIKPWSRAESCPIGRW